MNGFSTYIPLNELLTWWPDHLFGNPGLEHIAITGHSLVQAASQATAHIDLAIGNDLEIDLAGLEGFQLVLPTTDLTIEAEYAGDFELRASGFSAMLRIANPLLIPVDGLHPNWTPRMVNGEPEPLELSPDVGELVLDSEFSPYFEVTNQLALSPFMIGNTGIVVEVTGVRLYLSGKDIPPPGQAEGFRGVTLEQVSVYLPSDFDLPGIAPDQIQARNMVIGHGGVSGTFSGTWVNEWDGITPSGDGSGTLLGIPFALNEVGCSLTQNAFTSAVFSGELGIPFLDTVLKADVSIDNEGELVIGFTETTGDHLIVVDTPIGTFSLTSIRLETDDGEAVVLLSGSVKLTILSPTLTWPEIEFQELRIGGDGSIQMPDGWIDLPEPVGLNLFGFGFEITRIGFGNEEDGRRWVGFSGGLQLLPVLPTGVSVEGLRVIWDPARPDDEPEIRFQGIGMEFTIPNAIQFTGDVSLITEGTDRYFQGNANLKVMPVGLDLGASIKVGRNLAEDYKYLYLFSELTIPVGIPLFATGAAIYGFAGLYGMNVNPTTENGDWYGWYTGSPAPFSITHSGKWKGLEDGKALGAGLTVGTLFDAGKVVSAKGLFALVMPGPVIILQGTANFLSSLPDLNDAESEGIFSMLAILDALAGSIQLNLDAGWSKAQVLEIAASAEAYFNFNDPSSWHFYLGQDEPESRRIRAYVLSLFQADAYLMIDRDGIATGASISWGADWKFGPVKVILRSWIGGDASISFKPQQLAGSLNVGGEFEISVAGFGLGIAAEAILSGAAPTTYLVSGQLILRVKLPTPIKDLEEDILLEWKEEKAPPFEKPFQSIGLEHLKVDETWTELPNVAPIDPTDGGFNGGPIVPLDARPFVVFDRPINDDPVSSDIELTSVAPYPGSTSIDSYAFDYELKEVSLEKWSKAGGAGWVQVEDLYGTWMAEEEARGDVAAMKFQLWTLTPFAFTRRTSRTYRDAFLQAHVPWPCTDVPDVPTYCVYWTEVEGENIMPAYFEHMGLHFTMVSISPDNFENPVVTAASEDSTHCNQPYVLLLPDGLENVLWITFPEPAIIVELCIAGFATAIAAFSNGTELDRMVNVNDVERIGFSAFDYEGQPIDTIGIWGPDNLELAEICYILDAHASSYSSSIDHLMSVFSNALRWDSEDFVLEPETWYRLTVVDETVRTHKGSTESETHTNYAYFQTASPPGLSPAWALGSAPPAPGLDENTTLPYPHGGSLTDLAPYIESTIPAHGAQPVYRSYDLGADFNENYVKQMYGADMAIRLLDGNARPVMDEEGNEVIFPNLWANQPIAELGETEYPYTVHVENCYEGFPFSYAPNQKILFANGVLLDEDFSDDLSDWIDPNASDTSAWALDEGRLIYSTVSFPSLGALLVAGEETWTDYAIEVQLSEDGDDVGLVCRHTGTEIQSYYRLRLSPGGHFFERIVDGHITVLWENLAAYRPGDYESIAIYSQGNRLRGQIDTFLLFDLVDDEPLLEGRVGIYTHSTSTFEHFLVREWPGGALASQTMYQAELMASFALFQGGLNGGWLDTGYAWIELNKKDGSAKFAALGRSDWDNYRFEVNMERVGSRVGAIVRYTDFVSGLNQWTFRCYRLQINLNTESIQLDRFTGTYDEAFDFEQGDVDTLWECTGAGCDIDFLNDSFDAVIECIGDTISAWINGIHLVTVTDPLPLLTGKAGLYYLGNEEAGELPGFSELIVHSAPRQAVHTWNFTTSRYEGFIEHMDSFEGLVHQETVTAIDAQALEDAVEDARTGLADLYLAYETARAELATAVETADDELVADAASDIARLKANVQTASDAWHASAHAHFNTLHQLLLGSAYRPLPPIVELTELVDGAERYALLLESPEPLDWSRTVIQLYRWNPVTESYDPGPDIAIAWSIDSTRAYLLPDSLHPLDPGTYMIQLSYDLDIGFEAPLLRRSGSILPEVAALFFDLLS